MPADQFRSHPWGEHPRSEPQRGEEGALAQDLDRMPRGTRDNHAGEFGLRLVQENEDPLKLRPWGPTLQSDHDGAVEFSREIELAPQRVLCGRPPMAQADRTHGDHPRVCEERREQMECLFEAAGRHGLRGDSKLCEGRDPGRRQPRQIGEQLLPGPDQFTCVARRPNWRRRRDQGRTNPKVGEVP